MKKLGKRVVSFILAVILVVPLIGGNLNMQQVSAEGEAETGVLSFAYRWGNSNLFQVNTNLPSDTPCANFLATDNGCVIDQSGNKYQQVGSVSMANADGTIVLTFNFNRAFENGQTYVLPKGAIFGFTDGKKYALDKDYTFTWDGSNWSMEAVAEPEVLSLTYHWGNNDLLQLKTNLSPNDIKINNFLMSENSIDESQGAHATQYVQMNDDTNPIMFTLHFHYTEGSDEHGTAYQAGEKYVLKKGSEFTFNLTTGGTGKYVLDKDYIFVYNGETGWSMKEPDPEELSLTYHWGNSDLLQLKTNLSPDDIAINNFLMSDNGIDESQGAHATQYVQMNDDTNPIMFTLHFHYTEGSVEHGTAYQAGEKYVLKKGSEFTFSLTTGGTGKYVLAQDYTFTFNGTDWAEPEPDPEELELTYHWGDDDSLQLKSNLPADITCADFSAASEGYTINQAGSSHEFWYANMLKSQDSILLSFNFTEENKFSKGESYTLKQGSIFVFGGTKYILNKDYLFTYTGTKWVEGEWVENDVNGDGVVNVADYLHLKKVLKEIVEKDDRCDIIGDGYLNDWDMTLMRELLFGLVQGAEEIMARPAYILEEYHYQGGEDFITFADMPVDSTDTAKIEEFKALGFNTSLLTEDCVDSNVYKYSGECTTSGETTVSGEKLELEYIDTNGSYIRFSTNLPVDASYPSSFLVSSEGFQVDVSGSAETPGWFSVAKDDTINKIIITMVLWKDNADYYLKPGEQQVLRAGSTFTFNGTVYTLDKTYTVTICNDYLQAIENLDKAGLNVWIRNQNNRYGYFTDAITAQLKKYADVIDGFYMADEAFETNDLLTTAGQEDEADDFTSLAPTTKWLNTNFPNAYYHMNQVPIGSYDHYGDGETQNADYYTAFLQNYQDTFLKNLNANSGKSICFDNYPFIQKQSNGGAFSSAKPGIAQTYLQNMVLAANSAKNYNANSTNGKADFGTCIQTFKASSGDGKTSRDITKAEEVSFQLYVGMACGADLFEYFAYNSYQNSDGEIAVNGIIDVDGNQRIYNLVKTANDNALCFADVINTFTWQGIETSNGSKNNANKSAFSDVSSLVLGDANNGVLSSVSSTDDAMVGCFTKGEQDGYMVVNYNDPVAVTDNNSVTLNFAGCTQARVYTGSNGELQSKIVNLSNGSYTVTLTPGSACFIIPV